MHHVASWFRRGTMAMLVGLAAGCDSNRSEPLAPASDARPSAAVSAAATAYYSDGAGKGWRQLRATTGVSWTQVVTICPRDGVTPCSGTVGGRDLTGWVWATAPQVVQLISRWAPDILTSPTMQVNTVFAGIGWTNTFQPTQWFANTYSSSESAYGWTASSDATGNPLGAGGGWSTPPHAGGAGVGVVANAAEANATRGVMLWRADGSDGRVITAAPDTGAVDAPAGGIAVLNVLANDRLAGDTARVSSITLTQLSSSVSGVALVSADGSVKVAAGTPAGVATIAYAICETANPSNCAQTTVAIAIRGNVIVATDDAGTTSTLGGTAVADVRSNDLFGVPVTLATVSSSDAAVTLDIESGRVSVAPGSVIGTRTLVYRLCETASPTNCATATATVTVIHVAIDAVNDVGSAPSSTGGIALASVLANDRLGAAAATLSNVTLSRISSTSASVSLDPTDGSVVVAPQTPGGSYSLLYRICERDMQDNCDQATVTVSVASQSVIVSPRSLTVKEGATGTFTIRLSQIPSGPVTVTTAFYAGTIAVAPSPSSITFSPSNWNIPLTVTFAARKDSDKIDDAATIHVTIAGGATVPVVVRILDTSRSSTDPTANLSSPLNGQSFSGLVPLAGTGTDINGTVVEGRFLVDGVRIYTDVNSTGSYQVPGRWNSASVANGWHTLEMRVTDDSGKSGRMNIRVLVAN